MPRRDCTVYVGNLDERVSEEVLYEIFIQVGHIVDLHLPRDKESNRHKGYAFVEYEREEIASYAVKLFSGVVRLYDRPLKLAIAWQDKAVPYVNPPITPTLNTLQLPNPHSVSRRDTTVSCVPTQPVISSNFPGFPMPPLYPHGVFPQESSGGIAYRGINEGTSEYSQYTKRLFGSVLTDGSSQFGWHPLLNPSY